MIRKFLKGFSTHTFLILMSFLSLFPFLWLISTALKGIDENIFQYPPYFIPKNFTWDNFIGVWKQIPFLLYFLNSFIVAAFTVILNLIFSSLAAYPLCKVLHCTSFVPVPLNYAPHQSKTDILLLLPVQKKNVLTAP